MDNRDKIIQIVRMKGPLLPSQINKELNTNVLFASAMLSEMVDKKTIKLSHLKVGGSPLYYAPGQEHKLQNFSEKLGEKEKRAYDLLKENLILNDKELEPVMRAALRMIPDFAKLIEIIHNNENILFWKWFLLPEEQIETIIKKKLGIEEKQKILETEIQTNEEIPEKKDNIEKTKIENQNSLKSEIKKDEFKLIDLGESSDDFLKNIKKYFNSKNIEIKKYDIIRKKSEIDFNITIPSAVGKLNYYCKAKNKKKCNEGDLSSAFVHAQAKKLPVLFLTTGEITKKAELMRSKEFNNMIIKKIDED